MKASTRDLFPLTYNAEQTASSIRCIPSVDRTLIEDGTYFVIESGGDLVSCGGWSRRDKLYTGSGDAAGDATCRRRLWSGLAALTGWTERPTQALPSSYPCARVGQGPLSRPAAQSMPETSANCTVVVGGPGFVGAGVKDGESAGDHWLAELWNRERPVALPDSSARTMLSPVLAAASAAVSSAAFGAGESCGRSMSAPPAAVLARN